MNKIYQTYKSWQRYLLLILLGTFVAFQVSAAVGTSFSQASNKNNTQGTVVWIGSIVQSSNSTYYEGQTVLQRLYLEDIPKTANNQHTLRIMHQSSKGGIHAYDFLTNWPQGIAASNAIMSTCFTTVDGCSEDKSPMSAAECSAFAGSPKLSNAIPTANYGLHGGDDVASRVAAWDAANGNGTGRQIEMWATGGTGIGGTLTITNVQLVFQGYTTDGLGDSYALYDLNWTMPANEPAFCNYKIHFAGHIAVSGDGTGVGYGVGKGASAISGGPYHFKLGNIDGISLGSQDNQLKGADILIPPPTCDLAVVESTTAVTCNGRATGSIILAITGTSSYTVTWTGPSSGTAAVSGTATQTISGLVAGSYSVSVTDDQNAACFWGNPVISVAEPPAVALTATPTNPLCSTGLGSITFSATGGTGAKTYTVNGNSQASPATGLAAGTYTVVATDTNGCTDTKVVQIVIPTAVVLTATPTNPLCSTGLGSITFSATGGTGAKTYTVNGNSQASPATGLAAGTYTVVATDTNGCTDTKVVQIVIPTAVVLTATPTNPLCSTGLGSITFSATGGTGAKTYTVNGNSQASPATGLAAGTYTVVATDTNGCTDTKVVQIVIPTAVVLTATPTNPLCSTGLGSITFSATGGTGAKTYTVNGNSQASPATGLAAGTYTVVATDTNGCTDTKVVQIVIPTAVVLTATPTNPLCSTGLGSITFSATGGTGAKTYTVNGNSQASPATGLAAGTYTVVATDTNGCTDTKVVQIVIPTAVVLTATPTNPLCSTGLGSITFSATGGTGAKTYTVNGNSQASPATGLAAGTYTVVATDTNGCTDTKVVQIVIPTAVVLTATPTNPLCSTGLGSITFSATGGTGAKTYTVNGNSQASPATGLAAGTYTVVATDTNGCTDTKVVQIVIPTAVVLTATPTNPLCSTGLGSITFSATGGTGAKTYTVNGNSQASPATGLAAGTYTVVATDTNGCTDTKVVQIVIPTAVVLTATPTNPLCSTGLGSITFSATGGTGAKTYTVNGNSQASPATGLAAGTYTVVATDTNGCTDTKVVQIVIPTAVVLTATPTNPLCSTGLGSITFSATGGTGAKTYTVNGNSQASPATGLAAGTYTVVATDTNGCTDTKVVQIVIPTAVVLTATPTNPLCSTGLGSITFSATGGTGAKTYTVNGNSQASPATGLAAGTYTVVATDTNGCTDTKVVQIVIPTAVVLTATPTNPLCSTGLGSITFSATGGTGAKTYTVNGNSQASPATGLAAGTYTVVATDTNGCTDTKVVQIVIPTAVVLTATPTNPLCSTGLGSITFSATGGTGAKTYTVNGNSQASPATGLAAGTYTVVATDTNGCTDTKVVQIVIPTAVVLTATPTNPLCSTGLGSITFSATGGTGAKTYTVNGNSQASPATGLAAGTYTVVATDTNGCTDTKVVQIVIPTAVVLTATPTNPLCSTGLGSITFSATGGTGAKTYTVNGNSQASPATGLAAGTYTVVATDTNGCTDTKVVQIVIPTAVVLTATPTNPLCSTGLGSITFSATGGTGAKTYTVNGNSQASPATGLAAGTYTVVATDTNGCTDTKVVQIVIPTAVVLTATPTNPLCSTGLGSITFSATGGTGAKTYTVNGNSQASPATGLAAGTYTVVATDTNGCTDTKVVQIVIPTAVVLTATPTNPLCSTGLGSITFSATGGTGAKTYTVNGNSQASPATGLAAGTYTVVATDTNGCTDTKVVQIVIPTAVVLTATPTNPLCSTGLGSITFSATGGTGAKTYTVNGNSQASPATGLAAGTYTVVATDTNGCTDTKVVQIVIPTAVVLTATPTNPLCSTGLGSITFSATGGTGAKTYTVNGNSQASPATGLAAGTYTVVATDTNGCTDTKVVQIVIPTAVVLTATPTNPLCSTGLGSITFSATGGTGAKTYTVNGNSQASPATGLAAGTYTVVATDTNGCTDTKVVQIVIPTAVVLTATPTNPLCSTGLGSITFSATGGTGAKTYTVNGNSQASPATGLAAGTYTVVATDTNGCTDTKVVQIVIPTAVVLTATPTNPLCSTGLGSITFSATGGTGAKTYTVNGNSQASPATGLAAGTYTVVATDTNGCTDTKVVQIVIPTAVVLTATPTNPLCSTGLGSITFSATGGTGAKTYTVNGNSQASPATGLAAGTYTVVATDTNGCTDTKVVQIVIPTAVVLTATPTNPLCSTGLGSITFSATGGTGAKTYTVNGNSQASPATGLAAGTYTVVATDTNGCTDTKVVQIVIPTAVACSIELIRNASCENAGGSATVTPVGGTGPYSVIWGGSGETSTTAENLPSGYISVTVTDANGCTSECDVTIPKDLCEEFCTYTQGKYGNQDKSKACNLEGSISTSLFVANLLAQGPLQIGGSVNYVLFQAGDADVINSILPGGSGTSVLNGACIVSGTTTCLSSKGYLTKKGTLNNGLFAQTLTLGLNLRITTDLANLPLEAGKYLTTQKKLSCEKGSGVVDMVCKPIYALDGITIIGYNKTVDPYGYYTLNSTVVDFLGSNPGYTATVGGLYQLANDALGGMTLPAGLSLSNIMSAVDLINNAFDECRAFVGYFEEKFACPAVVNQSAQIPGFAASELKAYPNPFSDRVMFEFTSKTDSHAVLEINNILGQKIKTLMDKQVKMGVLNRVEYTPSDVVPGILIYRLILDGSIQNGRIIYKK